MSNVAAKGGYVSLTLMSESPSTFQTLNVLMQLLGSNGTGFAVIDIGIWKLHVNIDTDPQWSFRMCYFAIE